MNDPSIPAIPFDRTRAIVQAGIDARQHIGAQLYVSRHGKVLIDLAMGESRPGVAMTTDTLTLWRSSGKPITAVAIAQLWERGLLDLDDRVVKFIPEFGARGKEAITVRHLLTHTAGFRVVIGLEWNDPIDVAIAKICKAPLEPRWIPGRSAGYHASSSWYVLSEIIQRIDGRPFGQYIREMIFKPLEMNDTWIGMPPERYRAYGDRIGMMYDTSKGTLADAESANTESDAQAVRASSNARGPIRELGRFYEALRPGVDSPILRRPTIEAITSGHRVGMVDQTFKRVMDWGLGFILNSEQYGAGLVPYGYGRHASARVFGHGGQESSCGFCDPEHGLVVAWICNGMPGAPAFGERQRHLNAAVYEDVGIGQAS